jgi:hypothetical protein
MLALGYAAVRILQQGYAGTKISHAAYPVPLHGYASDLELNNRSSSSVPVETHVVRTAEVAAAIGRPSPLRLLHVHWDMWR